ncbi:MAG: Gfo/Idh/MocA family oxidoreductase [Candidatus Glassbacteria bacterium]|nr:Gfo/Idh/MocA family oxidoreductase [Candidatus Glassbacteria bacterium]
MSDQSISRREAIRKTSLGAAGLAMAFGGMQPSRVLGANDRVRVGFIGIGSRCRSLMQAFQASAKDLNMEIGAICDIWNKRRESGAAFVKGLAGTAPRVARNTDELYEMKDIEAVVCATADFQHAYHCCEAVRAGRDIYIEKPLANRMMDAREVLKTVTGSDRIVQMGTQRRSGLNYRNAAEFIQSGRFGKVKMVEMTWNVNQPKRWRHPDTVAGLRQEDTDWRRFLVNRPYIPWNPRIYIEFRLFWPFSTGIPGQWMVHQIDTVHWFTGYPRPKNVVANGGLYLWDDGRRNADTFTAVFEYGEEQEKFQVVYSSRQTNSYGGVKEIYLSNSGALNLDTNKITGEGGLTAEHSLDSKDHLLQDAEIPSGQSLATGIGDTDDMTVNHMRNFMECVRSRKQPNADINAGYQHAVANCMTAAALHTGKRVTFDDAVQEVVDS